MYKQIERIVKNSTIQNGVWLYILQLFNMVIPLVTLPYITRILGAKGYGVFSYVLNIVGYFQIIIEYGFQLSGARKVALNPQKENLQSLFSGILSAKIALCIISTIGISITGVLLNFNNMQIKCMSILYLILIGEVLKQVWLFQGLEEMKVITIIGVVARTISVIGIFLMVKYKEQIYLYCFLYAISNLLNGIISIWWIKVRLKLKITLSKSRVMKQELKEGWYTFTTSIMSNIFSGIGVTILGIVGSDFQVGVYSAIQKIPQVLVLVFIPIGQAMYPTVSKAYATSFQNGWRIIKKISSCVIPIFIIIGGGIIYFSKQIITLLYGEEYLSYSNIILPLVLWMIFSIINNFLGVQTLVGSGHLKEYSHAFNVGVVSIIILNIILGKIMQILGVSIAAVTSEMILTIMLAIKIIKIRKTYGKGE